ncbi:heme oxygenase-like protein [Annulohypoxylon maeteangense]|uniref:heme oxygenase-like protein n=1 Tax=Annulohypoxylon maeteangense TaxID=1927788 RepID=UPI00200756EC|nr:heme oxygenase-like protein [Annulohypoxylon maeteangense]KAI0883247.1 heme oxygenase-like protein [Annulohypoxylon maeteangense]
MPSKTEDVGTAPESRTLGESINIATRPVHTSLNKLIILRLRLALPPHADDASNYVQGLLHITPIYTTFETLWQEILDTPPLTSEVPVESTPTSPISPRIHTLLTSTHFPILSRSASLKADLSQITGWSASDLSSRLLEASRESAVLAAFLAHIQVTVGRKPHSLLAYAWVLYMALFAGGRFIRASLERVDPRDGFWGPLFISPNLVDDEIGDTVDGVGRERMPGAFPSGSIGGEVRRVQSMVEKTEKAEYPLSFFRFDTPADGQDLRQAFKARVAEATDVLTAEEIADVVGEAREIFERMVGLVGELDDVCGTEYEAATAV